MASLADYCDRQGVAFAGITSLDIQGFLMSLKERDGLALNSISRRLIAVKVFCRFCYQHGLIEHDVAALMEMPKKWQTLPYVLNYKQVDELLAMPEEDEPLAMRDQAILELFYATGVRVSELVGLRIDDVHLDVGYLHCMGKGRKERIVPVGARAVEAVGRYLGQSSGRSSPTGARPTGCFSRAPGGRSTGPTAGGWWSSTPGGWGWPASSRRTRYGIASRRICWRGGRICTSCRRCWGMRISPPRKSTRTWIIRG